MCPSSAENVTDAQFLQDLPFERSKTFYFADDPMGIFLVRLGAPFTITICGMCLLPDTVPQVENQLFKVHRHFLIEQSDVFRDMFSVPGEEGAGVEGMSDECPIPLPGVKVEEFESLLKCFYSTSGTRSGICKGNLINSQKLNQQSQEENLALLSIAHRFAFDDIFKDIVQQLVPAEIPIVQRVRLGDKYGLNEWLFSAYEELLNRKGSSLNVDELDALGSDRVLCLIQARESMLQERLDIARFDVVHRNIIIENHVPKSMRYVPAPQIPKNVAQVAKEHFTMVREAYIGPYI